MRTCNTVAKMSIYLHWPYVAVLHLKTTESQPYIPREIFICTCLDLSVHVHGEAVRGRDFKQFKTSIESVRYWSYRHCITSSHTNL